MTVPDNPAPSPIRRLRLAWAWKVWPWSSDIKLLNYLRLPKRYGVPAPIREHAERLARERGLLPHIDGSGTGSE